MRAKYQSQTPKEILASDEDQLILEIFAKHQVLGGTRNEACQELQQLMKKKISEAALKLRFYRLVQKRNLSEEEINALGRDVLKRSGVKIPETPLLNGKEVPPLPGRKERVTLKQEMPKDVKLPLNHGKHRWKWRPKGSSSQPYCGNGGTKIHFSL